jgi:glycine/D-amino acid oxidase-like deaminating enzyme/nitrite reductase/ring-hydroxylating ferredoxin subunit
MRDTVAKDGGFTSSPWIDATVPASGGELAARTLIDACVVGAGIAGLATAYELLRAGYKVVVLDDGPIGGGESARTSAHLSSALDDRFHHLERVHGHAGARLAYQSHAAAIDRIEELAARFATDLGVDCELRRIDGYLFVGPGGDRAELERERLAAQRAGASCELVSSPLRHFDLGPCLRFADQARVHPLAYLSGLARAVLLMGGAIHAGVRVEAVEDGDPVEVRCADGRVVRCGAAVVATNSPINDRVKLHTKQAAYRSYCVALEVEDGALPDALLWDTSDPYHYVRRIDRSGQAPLVLVGGEDHKTGQADDGAARWERLEAWARERFPGCGARVHWWSGQIVEPVDGLAHIGRNPGDRAVYVLTGDSGHGLTHGVLGAILLRDLIRGRDNPWAAVYDPARKPLREIGPYVKENANAAAQYGAWFTPGDLGSFEELEVGAGAIIRRGRHKLAVYRDADGELHVSSATCPHLGAVVAWNPAEKTFDCPAHGSRFDAFGRCVNGPSACDLERRDQGGAPLVDRDAEGQLGERLVVDPRDPRPQRQR